MYLYYNPKPKKMYKGRTEKEIENNITYLESKNLDTFEAYKELILLNDSINLKISKSPIKWKLKENTF